MAKVIHYEFVSLDDWVKVISSIQEEVTKFESMYPNMKVSYESKLDGAHYIIELYIEHEGEDEGIL